MKHLFSKFLILLMLLTLLMPAFAACGGVKVEVSFIVDGQVYDTVTTSSTQALKLPPNPEKEGYVFRGWYWDDGVWEKPFTASSLKDAPLSDSMRVYAYFAPVGQEETTTTQTTEPTTEPSTTEPSTTEPSTTEPSTTEPSTTEPPTTEPPTTEPPTTEPPTTEPPTTEPEPEPPVAAHIAIILAGANGLYSARGIVIGINTQSFLLDDGTGVILVNLQAQPEVEIGDIVTVVGTTKKYALAKQFSQDTVVTVEDHAQFWLYEPKAITAEELNALATPETFATSYVQLTGNLMISEDGKNYHLNIDGTALIGSLTYPDATLQEILNPLDEKPINVIGFITGVEDGTYLNIMVCNISPCEPDEPTDLTPSDILDIAYGLDWDEVSQNAYTLTGEIVWVDTEWNEIYENITVTIVVDGDFSRLITCYRLRGDGAKHLQVGDIITVTGHFINYYGIIEFNAGCSLDNVIPITPIQPEPDEPPVLIEADVATILASDGGYYTTSGVVICVNAQSFLLDDGTGTILVYLETDPGVQVGDTVTVIGSTKTYALAKEFVQDTVVTVTGHTEVASKEPQKLTGEQIDALLTMEQIDPIYVEVSGMLFSAEDGKYYNMFIYGTTLMGSLTYPDASLKATLDSMEYENVTVIGYVTGIVNDLYVNIMVDRIV